MKYLFSKEIKLCSQMLISLILLTPPESDITWQNYNIISIKFPLEIPQKFLRNTYYYHHFPWRNVELSLTYFEVTPPATSQTLGFSMEISFLLCPFLSLHLHISLNYKNWQVYSKHHMLAIHICWLKMGGRKKERKKERR